PENYGRDLVWRFLLPSLPRQRKSHIFQGLVPNSQTVFPEVLLRSSRFYAVPFHGLFSLHDVPVLPKLPFAQWFSIYRIFFQIRLQHISNSLRNGRNYFTVS